MRERRSETRKTRETGRKEESVEGRASRRGEGERDSILYGVDEQLKRIW